MNGFPSSPGAARPWRAGLPTSLLVISLVTLAGCSDEPLPTSVDPTVEAGRPDLVAPTGLTCTPGAAGTTLYLACLPTPLEAWNGRLVVWAHGYVDPTEPVALPDDEVDGVPLPALVTSLGYGYATTSYAANGLVADVAPVDLDAATQFFAAVYGAPTVTFLTGASEGGLTSALALERSVPGYDGGLLLCGPNGSFAGQIDYIGDFRVLFDYYFPGVIDNDDTPGNTWRPWGYGGSVHIPDAMIQAWRSGTLEALIAARLQARPATAKELLDVAHVAYDSGNPATIVASALAVLRYNVMGTNDVVERLGGNPYDNRHRLYPSTTQFFRLNLRVVRISADPDARAGLASFETTGDLQTPAVALHTTLDPDVPFWQSLLYRAEAYGQGIGPLQFNSLPVDRYGHCAFTAEEVLGGFALLVHKVTGDPLLASSSSLRRIGVDPIALKDQGVVLGGQSGDAPVVTLW